MDVNLCTDNKKIHSNKIHVVQCTHSLATSIRMFVQNLAWIMLRSCQQKQSLSPVSKGDTRPWESILFAMPFIVNWTDINSILHGRFSWRCVVIVPPPLLLIKRMVNFCWFPFSRHRPISVSVSCCVVLNLIYIFFQLHALCKFVLSKIVHQTHRVHVLGFSLGFLRTVGDPNFGNVQALWIWNKVVGIFSTWCLSWF